MLDEPIVRNCYDFTYSHLTLDFDLEEKKITGDNELYFDLKCSFDTLVLDLYSNFQIDSVLVCNVKSNFKRHDNQIFVPNNQCLIDGKFIIQVFYHGVPVIADNPPWNGGFVWSKDNYNFEWVGVACQKDGASLWWPNKDDLSDEPDSMRLNFTTKNPYFIVANGRLDTIINLNKDSRSFNWFISNPINNYNVTFNIANYAYFNDSIKSENGFLTLDYYVLPENLFLAKNHFKQVKPMMAFFEKMFGVYPFYSDGYKLVETSYLGMEHQGCISYGNRYNKGYLGNFPAEIDFDFIIIHETAHEWWGNNVSMENRRDMWIHESFATYAEALYVEEFYGYNNMLVYLNDQKKHIKNIDPIISENHSTTDLYYKGSWMLHTLRNIIDNDSLWYSILTGIQVDFRHQNVNTNDIIDYIEKAAKIDLNYFFQQYLYESDLPVLQYYFTDQYNLNFRWKNSELKFHMPVLAKINNNSYDWIYPDNRWKKIKISDPNIFEFADSLLLFNTEIVNL